MRILAIDALERIEMALRVDIAHLLGQKNLYAHEIPECLHGKFSKKVKERGKHQGQTLHQIWLKKYNMMLQRSKNLPFVDHYLKKYKKLPIWVAIEVWDFGMMSKLYAGMKIKDQQIIASRYGVQDEKSFVQCEKPQLY